MVFGTIDVPRQAVFFPTYSLTLYTGYTKNHRNFWLIIPNCAMTALYAGSQELKDTLSQGYIKEAAYQFSDLYPRGKVSNSWAGVNILQTAGPRFTEEFV